MNNIYLAQIKSTNGSEYYGDGLQKGINSDYATTPCCRHAFVSVDGQLVPLAYPTLPKSPKLCYNSLSPNSNINDNSTMRLHTNPIHRCENEKLQENFYHTLNPFSTHGQYEEHACKHNQPSMSLRI